jgi:hypothetical protein
LHFPTAAELCSSRRSFEMLKAYNATFSQLCSNFLGGGEEEGSNTCNIYQTFSGNFCEYFPTAVETKPNNWMSA